MNDSDTVYGEMRAGNDEAQRVITNIFGPEYPKIQTAFKRDERNLIIVGEWTTDEFRFLADVPWTWTEKVDGTNIRIHWNGENVTVGGRTNNAQVPTSLIAALGFLNHPPLWSEIFPDASDVTVYGEGYGAKIQSGGQYRSDQTVIVFDVRVGAWWLKPDDVKSVAARLGLEVVPSFAEMTLNECVDFVQNGKPISTWPNAKIEGLVGHPKVDLYDRRGERITAKIKLKDFTDLERRGKR